MCLTDVIVFASPGLTEVRESGKLTEPLCRVEAAAADMARRAGYGPGFACSAGELVRGNSDVRSVFGDKCLGPGQVGD